ncbi:hypothetical protein GCM10009759_06850 [Kitasatospora saccharophila]|uniref:3-octaprenyl-4-hydroxybenzoate carboxy-lyase-like Rift-related domain-containing protein n=1 Tax=Kitasatospora saccharophila TaxID=407973 RepID=A0ABP5HTF4_9ACTN
MPLPAGVSEDGYVGAPAGAPVEVVRAETNDLLVPANSEIVLEGWVEGEELAPEGPMGEYHGYAFPEGGLQPVFHVEAVTCWIVVSVERARRSELAFSDDELAELITETLFASHPGWLVPKVIVVDDDIDVTDVSQVVWALATRHHPQTGTRLYPDTPDTPGLPVVPYLTTAEAKAGRGGKSVTNCPLPHGFPAARPTP